MTTRILLADDHSILREGLRGLLEAQGKMKVVAEAENGVVTLELVGRHQPHIVIMDISMPGMNGFEATKRITTAYPGVKVIALSMFSDRQYVAKMFDSGASAYLRKDCVSDEIHRAIATVLEGNYYIGPSISGAATGVVIEPPRVTAYLVTSFLTAKERAVLQLVAEGRTTKYIATELDVSEKTVEKHRQHIMEKLGLHSVAELTKYAIREGITPLEK